MDSLDRFTLAETDRRLANILRLARVVAVDLEAARVKVADAHWQSGWLPWLERHAAKTLSWSPPELGEQVMILAPSGDLEAAAGLGGIYSDRHRAPSAQDGLCLKRLPLDHLWQIEVGNTKLRLEQGGMTLVGNLTLTGDLELGGDLSVGGDTDLKNTKINGIKQVGS